MRYKVKPYMLLSLLPLVAIVVFCFRYNQDFFQYFLPNSRWNDELFYYKTIEGITRYGMPQGYFGYNESHALVGTLGAWSPIIYTFDAIWGAYSGGTCIPLLLQELYLQCWECLYML